MITIYKYKLEPYGTAYELPKGAEILCVQIQRDSPCIWAKVDTEEFKTETRHIIIVGTGHALPDEKLKYIGTFQIEHVLVFHVFELEK